MRSVLLIVFAVMAVWLVLAAVLRVALLLSAGLPLDPLPFISGGLGIAALLLLYRTIADTRQARASESGRTEPGSNRPDR